MTGSSVLELLRRNGLAEGRGVLVALDASQNLQQADVGLMRHMVGEHPQVVSGLGVDSRYGGVYVERKPMRFSPVRDKLWWVQAEALNGYLLMHERHGHSTSVYFDCFLDTWSFIRANQLDHRGGGWVGRLSRDGRRVLDDRKGHEWKAAYHETRALLTTSDRLRRIANADSRDGVVP